MKVWTVRSKSCGVIKWKKWDRSMNAKLKTADFIIGVLHQ